MRIGFDKPVPGARGWVSHAPVRLLWMAIAIAAVLWGAWPTVEGPAAQTPEGGWVHVEDATRVDLTSAAPRRLLRAKDRPHEWAVLPEGFSTEPLRSDDPAWTYVRLTNRGRRPFDGVIAVRGSVSAGIASFERRDFAFDDGPRWGRIHRVPTVDVSLAPGASRELLLAVSPARGTLELWDRARFMDAMARADWALGLLMGLLFALAIYHLGSGLVFDLKSNLPFLAVLFGLSLLAYVYLGYAAAHWGHGAVTTAVTALTMATLAAGAWFTRSFLNVESDLPPLAGGFRGLEWSLTTLGLLGLIGVQVPLRLALFLVGLVTAAVFVAGWRARRRDYPALLFLVGWVPFAVSLGTAVGLVHGPAREPAFLVAASAAMLALAFSVTERAARERAAREAALEKSEQRYAYAAKGAHDGLFDYDLGGGSIYFSPRFYETLRLPQGTIEPVRSALLEIVYPEDRTSFTRRIDEALLDELQDTFQTDVRTLAGDGTVRWVMVRALIVRDDAGVAVRLVGSITDVHERKQTEVKLERNAFNDSTTGLSNRARVAQHLETLIELRAETETLDFGVLFVDLDRFKNVNDSLGHAAGDQLLGAIGRRLALVARDGDLVGRLGGDEFVLVLAGRLDVEDLERVARRVLEALSAPVMLEGHEVRLSASIGITHSDVGYSGVAEILEDADVAMHEAKRAGKGRYTTFDGAMRARVREHFELEAQMRGALERGEMQLFYQPIIRAADRSLAGFEALLRWHNPVRGMVSPGLFIPIAEESGTIRALGRFALFEATRQLAEWQASLPEADQWFVTVNVSPAQFGHDLLDEVSSALEDARIEPERLKLEITEGLFLGDSGTVKAEMQRIAEAGVPFSLDDFGTGFSSLSYLHDLPFDVLKIDRSFMRGLLTEDHSEAIVKSVLNLAAGLELATVAEGVETAAVADRLEALGAEYFQGYYFGRPQAPAALEEELRARGLIPRRSA